MLQKLLSISEYISPILHLSQVVIILVTQHLFTALIQLNSKGFEEVKGTPLHTQK